MKRRTFLSAIAAGIGVSMLPRAYAATSSTRLVFVFLRGGADALSLVSPRGAAFTTLKGYRPNVAIANPVPFTSSLAVHPAMAPLIAPAMRLNVILHAGSVSDTRSHFEQQYRVEVGDAVGKPATGFLGRAAAGNAMLGAAVSRTLPQSLRGSDALLLTDPAVAQQSYSGSGLRPGWSRAQRLGMFEVATGETGNATVDRLARAARQRGDVLAGELANVTLAGLTSHHGYVPSSVFAQRLAVAAQLATSNLDPRVITVDGEQFWDTHAAQHTNNSTTYTSIYKSIIDLATNLAAFRADLVSRNQWNQTVVVVMSEFGRTVRENGNAGTDHGRGGLMLLMGGRVRPHTDPAYKGARAWTIPAAPTATTPLAVQHDYRLVVGEICERHLGLARATVAQLFANQVPLGSTYLDVVT